MSTPDVLGIAKEFREDPEYLPNPVDTEIFYPKAFLEHSNKKRVLIASDSNWAVKGTDIAIRALSKIKDEVEVSIIGYGVDFKRTLSLAASLGLYANILPKVPHEKVNQYYWNADVVIDQFKLGSLGMVSLEAIACGRPVITYVSSEYEEYKDFPIKDVNSEEKIVGAIRDSNIKLWQKENEYLERKHKPEIVVRKLLEVYHDIIKS